MPAPVTAEQLVGARRPEDFGRSLWTTFQRMQENVIRGGQSGRSAQGRRLQTRPVGTGSLYRALRTTNPIENLNSSVARYCRNVKRWGDG